MTIEFGVHLPLIDFGGEPWTARRLSAYVREAADLGFRYICANDHLLFRRGWLDGPAALAAVLGACGDLTIATTVALPVIRGPVQTAELLLAMHKLSDGRFVAGLQRLAAAGRPAETFPHAVATTWLHVSERADDASRVIADLLSPVLGRTSDALRAAGLPIGSAEQCAERVDAYARAGAQRIFLWPLGDEVAQLSAFRDQVAPLLSSTRS